MSNFCCIYGFFRRYFFRYSAFFHTQKFIFSYTWRICTVHFAWFYSRSQHFKKNNRVEISVKKYLPHIPHEFAFTIFLVFTAFLSDIFSDILHFLTQKLFSPYTGQIWIHHIRCIYKVSERFFLQTFCILYIKSLFSHIPDAKSSRIFVIFKGFYADIFSDSVYFFLWTFAGM